MHRDISRVALRARRDGVPVHNGTQMSCGEVEEAVAGEDSIEAPTELAPGMQRAGEP
jgi:hypothetical protein